MRNTLLNGVAMIRRTGKQLRLMLLVLIIGASANIFTMKADSPMRGQQGDYKEEDENLATMAFQSEDKEVRGTVTDESGEPLVGAMVFIKGTAIGQSTDTDGAFAIRAPRPGESYVLSVQYLGMVSQEVKVTTQREVNFVLKQDNKLAEAVITGAYGTRQSREDLIGSAYQVSSEQFKNKPMARVDNLLQGLVPGMTIEPNADYAGTTRSRYETRIRGAASLSASNEPLWVVDGVPMYTGERTNLVPGMTYTVSPLSYLNPDDIESITVLKDADQVTIYGSDGSNGVILVTTKSGMKNKPVGVSARVNFGVSAIDKSTMFKMMNAKQYMTVAREAWANAGYPTSTFPFQDNDYNTYSTTSTDWTKEYLGAGSEFYADVSVSSGSDKATNLVSGSWYRNSNTVKGDSQQRFSLRSRNTYDLTHWLNADIRLSASYNDNDLFPLSYSYLETLPIYEPYMPDGSYRLYNKIYDNGNWILRKFNDNLIPSREEDTNRQRTVLTSANISVRARLMQGLDLTAQYAIDYMSSHEDYYTSSLTPGAIDSNGTAKGYSRRADASYINWTNVERLNFDRSFNTVHHVSALAGIELKSRKYNTLSGSGSGFMNDNIQEITYSDENSRNAESSVSTTRKMSFIGRAVYSYDSRYYASFNIRRDGSSDFGEFSKWSNFWSAGLSWNINRESFFHNEKISLLKLKASYGISGNSRADVSGALGTYSYGSSYSYGGASGAIIATVPNPGISWEKTRMFNFGIRIEIRNAIELELQAYDNLTSDLLSSIYVSRTLSSSSIAANMGELRNRGIELDLSSTNLRRGDFLWTTNFNMAHNSNKILKLYNDVPTSYTTRIWTEGHDSQTWYLVRWAGVDPTDGSPMWYDRNGNLTRTYSTDNRVADKSRTPILSGGMVNTLSWKNLSLAFQINYRIGGYALGTYASRYFADGYDITGSNQAVEVYYERWTTPGQAAAFPKVSQVSTSSGRYSTRFLYNATNFDLSEVSLTYNFPGRIIDRWKLKGLAVTAVLNNAYLFTPDQKRGRNSYKTMIYGYPRTRTLSCNISVSF